MNAKLLYPTLIATALIRKPEMVCKRAFVFFAALSLIFPNTVDKKGSTLRRSRHS